MTTQYDELGNVIGDDGSYPMEHIMAHAPSMPMPLQANGSDVPYVASEIPQTPPPVQQAAPAPQTPPPSQSFLERMTLPIQAAMTHMPGADFVQGITPAIQFPFQVAGGAAYGLANQAINPDTADFNADTTKFMENTTMPAQSKAGQEYGNVLGEIAQRTGPLPELMGLHPALSADDMRVALKQNVERAREFKNIPTDYTNAQSGISRESNLGGKTYGENLKNAAYDVADVAARQAARRSESAPAMPGSVQVFSDLVPDTKQYMMQGDQSFLWDKDSEARALALEAEDNPKTDDEIHYLTGTSRGGDNFQRQELSDVGALVNPGFFELYKVHPQAMGKLTHQLPDVYEHPSIFTAYPQLRNIVVQVGKLGKASAQYDEVNKILTIDSGIMHDPRLVKEAIEHEITHEIQVIQGWEKGGNSDMFPSKKVAETAQFLEQIMQQYGVSAQDAAKMYKKQFLLPHKVDPDAVRYANDWQGSLLPDTSPVKRYQHMHGEIEAETGLGRSDLEQNQLHRFYPWAKDPKDVEGTLPQFTPDPYGRPRGRGAPIGVDPSNALYRSARNAKGKHVFSKTPKYYRMPIASTTPVAQMSAELATKPELQMSESKPVDLTKRKLFGLGLKSKDQLPAVIPTATSQPLTTSTSADTNAPKLNTINLVDAAAQAIANMPMSRRKLLTTAGNAVLSHAGRSVLSKATKIPTFTSNPVIDQGLQDRTLDYFNYDMNSVSPIAYLTAIYKNMRKNLTDRVHPDELAPYDAIQADLRSELVKLRRKGIEEDEVELTDEQLAKIHDLANFVRDKVPLLKPHEHVSAVKALRPDEDWSHTNVGVHDDLSKSKVLVEPEELAKYLQSSKLRATKPEIQQSVKEKGGNWPETWLDTNVKRLKRNIPEFDVTKPHTQEQGTYMRNQFPGIEDAYAMDFRKSGKHGMDYGQDFWPWMQEHFPNELNDLTNKQTTGHALNQWVDRRLKPYLRNDLATPTDPVRQLVDAHGISHIKDLENSGQYPRSAQENRKQAGMPEEGHATSELGKIWENLADASVHPIPAKEFIQDYMATAVRHPELYTAAEKDPNAKIHQLVSNFDTDLGLDHLMDELRSSLTGNVPPHLALTPKTLERMTMADAVRHVSKINDYREKQMAKTAAEDIKDFPAVKTYANGDKWHDLKLPDAAEDDDLVPIQPEDDELVDYDNLDDDLDYVPEKAYAKLDKMLKNEGDMMGHCIGTYTDEVASGNTKIFTLRDKSNKPHATVEMSVVPLWDELPTEVKAMGGPEQDQWIKDNPTVVLSQAKGKGNKPVIDKYQSQLLDLLNNPPNVHTIYTITDEGRRDLAGADIVDRDDTQSLMNTLLSKLSSLDNRMDRYHEMLQQNPDLPRFMSTDALAKLMKTPKGHKHGGRVHMAEGGDPTAARDALFEASRKAQAEKTAAEEAIRPRTYTERLQDMGRLPTPEAPKSPKGSGGAGFAPGTMNPFNPDSPLNRKDGGHVTIDTMRYALLRKKHG